MFSENNKLTELNLQNCSEIGLNCQSNIDCVDSSFTLLNNQLTIIPLPVICRIEALILLWMLNAMVLKKVSRTTLSCNVASKNSLITHSKSR